MLKTALTVLALVTLAACGGKKKEEPAAAPADTTNEASTDAAASESGDLGEGIAWAEKSHEQKAEYMKQVVVAKMVPLFQGINAEEFKEMNCVTCHGEGAKEGKFELPNAKLPPLNPADSFKKHMTDYPDMTKFMMQTVVPEMATLVEQEPYNPETQSGFGCFNCHTMVQ